MFSLGFGFVLGAVIGSFAKAIADRTQKSATFWGRSYCPHCKHKLSFLDLIPIFSWLFLKGKCRYCQALIPKEYIVIEILMGILIAGLFWINLSLLWPIINIDLQLLVNILAVIFQVFVVTVLVILLLIDLKTGLLPDRITLPASVIAALFLIINGGLKTWLFYQQVLASSFGKYLLPPHSNYFTDIVIRHWQNILNNFLAGIVGAALFIGLIIVTKGKGMGWGDVKYVLFLGLVLGFPNIAVALFLSFLIGALFAVGLIILGKKQFGQTIPFGPFLSIGALIALYWGKQLVDFYLQFSIQ